MSARTSEKQPLKLGFIGGGLNSAVGNAHFVASQMDGRWRVVAGAFSRSPDVNVETARAWHIAPERTYSDSRALIAAEARNLDAVAVLTPTPDHRDTVIELLEASVPVVCEKALAASLAEAREIAAVARRTGTFLAVTYNYSGYPLVRELRRRVASGELGRITQVQVEMPADAFVQPEDRLRPQAWRLSDRSIPTILLDLAVHLHHLVYFVTGLNPIEVNADFHHHSRFKHIVDDAYIWAHYEDAVTASMWVSKTALGYRNGLRLRIFGDRGSAEWYQEEPERLHVFDQMSRRLTIDRGSAAFPEEIRQRFKPGHPGGFVEAFANLYGDIAQCIGSYRKGTPVDNPYVFGFEHAVQGLRMLDAAAESAQRRAWVRCIEGESESRGKVLPIRFKRARA